MIIASIVGFLGYHLLNSCGCEHDTATTTPTLPPKDNTPAYIPFVPPDRKSVV